MLWRPGKSHATLRSWMTISPSLIRYGENQDECTKFDPIRKKLGFLIALASLIRYGESGWHLSPPWTFTEVKQFHAYNGEKKKYIGFWWNAHFLDRWRRPKRIPRTATQLWSPLIAISSRFLECNWKNGTWKPVHDGCVHTPCFVIYLSHDSLPCRCSW